MPDLIETLAGHPAFDRPANLDGYEVIRAYLATLPQELISECRRATDADLMDLLLSGPEAVCHAFSDLFDRDRGVMTLLWVRMDAVKLYRHHLAAIQAQAAEGGHRG